MSDKIYIIQPFRYQQALTKSLNNCLRKIPNTRLKININKVIFKTKLGTLLMSILSYTILN